MSSSSKYLVRKSRAPVWISVARVLGNEFDDL